MTSSVSRCWGVLAVRRGSGEGGSATLELALWATPVVLVIGFALGAGRVVMADGQVEQVAAEAARAASLARTPAEAISDGTVAGLQSLAQYGWTCAGGGSVIVNPAGFGVPVGQVGRVTVDVACTVPLSDLGIPLLPVSRTLTASAVSPVDTYRER